LSGLHNDKMQLPTRWEWLLRGFRGYVKRYVRKNFHAVRLSNTSHALPTDNAPLLLVLNHPGWWDPMIGVVLADLFPKTTHYAAIDAAMLKKYRTFNKLGFFGVDQSSLKGAAQFLRTGEAILAEPGRAVWVTAQGEFADVRQRPLNLRAGVGHLAARLTAGWVVPIALEYNFWTESKPEALVRIGELLPLGVKKPAKAWLADIELSLTKSLDVLNAETQLREAAKFTELLSGSVGVGGIYDAFRRSAAFVTGQQFQAGHGESK
jgi:1-acyl-sn-glycerol-3-phosphate acyltransferase